MYVAVAEIMDVETLQDRDKLVARSIYRQHMERLRMIKEEPDEDVEGDESMETPGVADLAPTPADVGAEDTGTTEQKRRNKLDHIHRITDLRRSLTRALSFTTANREVVDKETTDATKENDEAEGGGVASRTPTADCRPE